jgi:hypothetical protein
MLDAIMSLESKSKQEWLFEGDELSKGKEKKKQKN